MWDNKGYIKTLEAIFAIIMLFIFVFSLISTRKELEEPKIGIVQSAVIKEISSNISLRASVLNNEVGVLSNFAASILKPSGYESAVLIKTPGDAPTTDEIPKPGKNVYAISSVIAENLTRMNPKTLYLYSWEK